MAKLGFRTVEEMVGHTERLVPRAQHIDHWKARRVDLSSAILAQPPGAAKRSAATTRRRRTTAWIRRSTARC